MVRHKAGNEQKMHALVQVIQSNRHTFQSNIYFKIHHYFDHAAYYNYSKSSLQRLPETRTYHFRSNRSGYKLDEIRPTLLAIPSLSFGQKIRLAHFPSILCVNTNNTIFFLIIKATLYLSMINIAFALNA